MDDNFTQAAVVPFVALILFWEGVGEEREGGVACSDFKHQDIGFVLSMSPDPLLLGGVWG